MSDKQREAMQEALEALQIVEDEDETTFPATVSCAINALREALAEPERQPMTEAEISEMATQEEFLLVCDGIEELREIVRSVEQHHGITKKESGNAD